MKPSRVSIELRRIAAGIDSCSKEVQKDLVVRDLRRVLIATESQLSWSDSLGGPWTPASVDEIAAEAARRATGEMDVLLYVQAGGKTFQVGDMRAFHGDDAMSTYELMEIEHGGYNNGYLSQEDDLSSMIQEAAAGGTGMVNP